jgi:hypothetical protein
MRQPDTSLIPTPLLTASSAASRGGQLNGETRTPKSPADLTCCSGTGWVGTRTRWRLARMDQGRWSIGPRARARRKILRIMYLDPKMQAHQITAA